MQIDNSSKKLPVIPSAPAATPAVKETAAKPAANTVRSTPVAAQPASSFSQASSFRPPVRLSAPQAAPVTPGPLELSSPEAQSAVQKSLSFIQQSTPSARGVVASAPVSSQLTPNSVFKDELGMTHVRMDRTQDGVKVFGEQLISHLDKDGKVTSVTGNLSTIPAGLGKDPVKLSAQDAIAVAQKQFNGKTDSDTPPSAERVIVADKEGNYHSAYQVHMDNVHDLENGADPRRMNYFVDANSGEIVKSFDQVDGFSRKAGQAAGDSSGAQAAVAARTTPTDGTTGSTTSGLPSSGKADDQTMYSGKVDLQTTKQADGTYTLEDSTRGKGVVTYDAGNKSTASGKTEFTDNNDKWGESTDPSRAKAAVDAHYGAEMTYDFYKDVLGRDSIDDKGEQLKSYVHLDKNYDNAYWDGKQMQYGDGDGKEFSPLTTLDIAGHEITHGLTERTAGLVYDGESGGLNESFSDIMGTGVEWYASQKNPAVKSNFEIGEAAYEPGKNDGSQALRYMDDPTKDGYSLDNYQNFTPDTEVHSSSGISNNAFYLTAQGGTNRTSGESVDQGLGMEKSLKIYGRALTTYLTPNATFADAKQACISAAKDLYGADSQEVQTVTAAWNAVGVE